MQKATIVPQYLHPVLELTKYINEGKVRKVMKGRSVRTPGQELSDIIYVISGKLTLFIERDDGEELFFIQIETGNYIGQFFDFMKDHFHVIAEEESVVCFFPFEKFIDIVQLDRAAAINAFKSYASKVDYFANRIMYTNKISTTASLARFFCSMMTIEEGTIKSNNSYSFELPFSQKILSGILAIHPGTLSKIIKDLINKRVIEKKGRLIIVHDVPYLQSLIMHVTYE